MSKKPQKKQEGLKWKGRNFCVSFPSHLVKEKTFHKRMQEAFQADHFVRYGAYQKEPYSKEGKFHWQMYIETEGSQHAKRVLEWIAPSTYMKGVTIQNRYDHSTRTGARNYCMKKADGTYDDDYKWPGHSGRLDGTDFYEVGHWVPELNNKKKAMKKALEFIALPTVKWSDVINNDEIAGTIKSHMPYFKQRYMAKPSARQEGVQLRPWQLALMHELDGTPDPRKIIWYVDEKGNSGKTFMSRFLHANHDASVLGGKSKDMFYAYQNEGIIIFDLSRSTVNPEMGYIGRMDFDYEALESLKDGLIFNTKYESGSKYRPEDAHVVVFANGFPDESTMSEDRWDIRQIKDGTAEAIVTVMTNDAVPVPKRTDYINKLYSARVVSEEPNIDKSPNDWYW